MALIYTPCVAGLQKIGVMRSPAGEKVGCTRRRRPPNQEELAAELETLEQAHVALRV